jgi:hypothetical protein
MLSVGVLRSGHWNKPSNSTGRPCCTGTDSPPVIRCRRASPSHSGVIAIRPRPDRSRVPRRGGATGLAPETSSPLRTRGPRAVHPGENRMATPVVCSSEGMPSGSASGASQPPSPPVRAPHAPMTSRAPPRAHPPRLRDREERRLCARCTCDSKTTPGPTCTSAHRT